MAMSRKGHTGDVHLVLNFDYEKTTEPEYPDLMWDVDDWDDECVDIVL